MGWRRYLVASAMVFAVLAAACSSDDSSSSGTTSSADETTTTQAGSTATTMDAGTTRTPDFVDEPSSVRLETGFGPVPYPATDERVHLDYELYLTNHLKDGVTVTSVKVVDADDPDVVIEELSGDKLADYMTSYRSAQEETTSIESNETAIVYIDTSVASMDDVPAEIEHIVETSDTEGEALAPIEGGFVAPLDIDLPVLESPFDGGTWISAEACCYKSHHRRGPLTLGGQDFLAQRYAIDFIKLEDGRLYEGDDPKDLDSWYTYGQDALAVVDGTVSSVLEDENDITPFEPNPIPRDVNNITGNHVIIDMGNGYYVVYAHLQKDSVSVEVGDQVKVGDKVGLVGNSGNTDAPHLHIHVMDANHVVQSHSIPFLFRSIELVGSYKDIDTLLPELEGNPGPGVMDTRDPVEMEDVYPLELEVLDFVADDSGG